MTEMDYHQDYGHMEYERRRIQYLEGRIGKITEYHPLTELERGVLADMIMTIRGESAVVMDQEKAVRQYSAVIDWLQSTGRISPREWHDLKKLPSEKGADA